MDQQTARRLTILICTHNRARLLEKTLESLNAAQRPPAWNIDILVVANACSDETHDFLRRYQSESSSKNWLPLDWAEEPTPGKSRALNTGIARVNADLILFEDDDHRAVSEFLLNLCETADRQPGYSAFCGPVIPDWSGSEPMWLRAQGPYQIYPSPIPNYHWGNQARCLNEDDNLPGGGQIALRADILRKAGLFETEFGPRGHDLGGGEDTAYIKRIISLGACFFYIPGMLQYHYVDPERLRLGFILRLAYKRTFAVNRLGGAIRFIPRYLWRKLATHLAQSLFTFKADKRRFHLVRAASTLGEIRGFWARMGQRPGQDAH